MIEMQYTVHCEGRMPHVGLVGEEREHLPLINWDEQPGSWSEDGKYDPDAAPVILPASFDLPGAA
jgi:hypothetical protein